MRLKRTILSLALCVGVGFWTGTASAEPSDVTCGTFGTCVNWVADYEDAKQLAREQSKLLYVLHISGNFANPTFT